jgi:hypothetical protein
MSQYSQGASSTPGLVNGKPLSLYFIPIHGGAKLSSAAFLSKI